MAEATTDMTWIRFYCVCKLLVCMVLQHWACVCHIRGSSACCSSSRQALQPPPAASAAEEAAAPTPRHPPPAAAGGEGANLMHVFTRLLMLKHIA